jgi:protein-tyrosine phosphatase
VIDLHSHVLPGLDDGAADLADAVDICRAAVADGIRVLAATPHVREDYPTTAVQMQAALERVRAATSDLPLELLPGAELALDELRRDRAELLLLTLAGNPSYLLVETPYFGWPLNINSALFELLAMRITPVLAHPERNPEVQEQPERLDRLVAGGVLVQLTAASVDGRLGGRTRTAARALLDREAAHLIASDAHSPAVRGIGMSDAARALGDDALARWLTVDVPAAIVEGVALPARPPRQRGIFRRIRRR